MRNDIDTITAFEGFVSHFTPCCTSDEYHLELFKKVLEQLKAPRKDDKTSEIKELAVDIGYLYDWYQHSVPNNEWPDKYIDEVFHDFYLIPKQENEIKE